MLVVYFYTRRRRQPFLLHFISSASKDSVPKYSISTRQEEFAPCEKNICHLNSSFHLISFFPEEYVS